MFAHYLAIIMMFLFIFCTPLARAEVGTAPVSATAQTASATRGFQYYP